MSKAFTLSGNTDILGCNLTAIPMQEFSERDSDENKEVYEQYKKATPARVGIGHTGPRYHTAAALRFQADQYSAANAVQMEVPESVVKKLGLFEIQTKCSSKYEMLTRPDLGRLFSEETKKIISERCVYEPDVQIFIGDGLCSPAVEANVPTMYPAICAALEYEGITVGTPFFVRYCRVNTVRTVAELLHPKVTCVLIGERPGMLTSQSMSAYMAYNARYDMLESDYTVVANISSVGMPPAEAAANIADIIKAMLEQKTSGYGLKY